MGESALDAGELFEGIEDGVVWDVQGFAGGDGGECVLEGVGSGHGGFQDADALCPAASFARARR